MLLRVTDQTTLQLVFPPSNRGCHLLQLYAGELNVCQNRKEESP